MKLLSATLVCLSAVLFFGAAPAARAQSYDISWYKIAGGGGTSSGSTYTLSGTIGQPDAGTMSGGTYAIQGGFWGIYSAVQTPGAPQLFITPAGANVNISWAAAATGFTLQNNSSLTSAGSWAAVSQTTNTANGTNTVTIPATGGHLFFRLKYP